MCLNFEICLEQNDRKLKKLRKNKADSDRKFSKNIGQNKKILDFYKRKEV